MSQSCDQSNLDCGENIDSTKNDLSEIEPMHSKPMFGSTFDERGKSAYSIKSSSFKYHNATFFRMSSPSDVLSPFSKKLMSKTHSTHLKEYG